MENISHKIIFNSGMNTNDNLVKEKHNEDKHIRFFNSSYDKFNHHSFDGCWLEFQTMPMGRNMQNHFNLFESEHVVHNDHTY